jgi:4-amino-4-deoxy-L-arabinose transferase-like glycosyltransferase
VKINRSEDDGASAATPRRRKLIAFALAVFAVAFAVRLLTWRETRLEVGEVQTLVTAGYKRDARLFVAGGARIFFSSSSPLATPDSLGHPPAYPILLALIFKFCGESDTAIQFFQIFCDALAAVFLFLIVAELLNPSTALVAGLLCAVSPQLAWNSVLLLPDSLAVLPLLCAVYLIARATTRGREATRARARQRSRLASIFLAGALVGMSCWLRANALLLAPVLAVCVFFLAARGRRLRLAATLVAGALVVVGALTIRNAFVFRSFVPVSLGAGQTLLEGIGDYDAAQRFNVPATDIELMRQEADAAHRPDYADALLGADGITRERVRLRRGFSVIASHPFWFASVMLRRAASMLRLERTPRIFAPQKLVITATVLPLAIFGAILLARRRDRRALAMLLVVPAYYLCFQSIFHTEYRYTLAIVYFLFALAAVSLSTLAAGLWRRLPRAAR